MKKANAEAQKEAYEKQYHRMTQEPVGRLVRELSLPTIISMLVTNIYNMGDTFFVSQINTSASAATGVVFGLMAILQAFGFMFGHGSGTNISRKLGQRDLKGAKNFSACGFYLALLTGALIGVLGLIFLDPLMLLLGSTKTILPYARIYGAYILIAGPAMTLGCVMNNILRYEGLAFFGMIGLTSGGILNLFGDAFLINVCHMGIAGAGLSTAVTQYLSCVILIIPFLRGKTQSSFRWKYFTWKPAIVKKVIFNGTPSLMRNLLNALSTMLINHLAGGYGDAAVSAISIVNRIAFFLNCVTIGLGQGLQPIAAYNYGARIYSRLKKAYWYVWRLATALLVVLAVLAFLFADQVVGFFRNDPEVIEIGGTMMRYIAISMPFMAMSVFGDMIFQSIGQAAKATLLASLRRGVFLISFAYLLTAIFGIAGLEWAQSIAEMSASAIAFPMTLHFLHTLPKDKVTEVPVENTEKKSE